MMMASGPELLNEAQLRHWKSHAMVELLLKFTDTAMKQDDTVETLARIDRTRAEPAPVRAGPLPLRTSAEAAGSRDVVDAGGAADGAGGGAGGGRSGGPAPP